MTKNPTDNSIKFTFPDVTTTSGTPMIEIEFSVTVTTKPFADDLFLTNLFQSQTTNTAGQVESHLTGVVLHVRTPKLEIIKGVQMTDNTFANQLSGLPDTTEPYDSNVTGVDAKDQITFYLTVVNVGGATAYSISIKDSLPPCFKYESFMAISGPLPTTTVTPTLSPPNPPPGAMLTFTYPAGFTLAPGTSLRLKVVASLPPHPAPPNPPGCESPHNGCQTFTNNSAVQWSSFCDFEGAGICIPHTSFTPATDAATIKTAGPTISKTASTNQGHTTDPSVAIGEVVTYTVEVVVPEGITNNLQVTDTIPAGLALKATTASTTLTATNVGGLGITGSLTSAQINIPGNGVNNRVVATLRISKLDRNSKVQRRLPKSRCIVRHLERAGDPTEFDNVSFHRSHVQL